MLKASTGGKFKRILYEHIYRKNTILHINYIADTRYALVDTNTINYNEAIILFHSISDINHISPSNDITSQLPTYTITPITHNHAVTYR